MPEEHRTKVLYEAIADFSDLTRAAAAAKKALKELRDEERKLNQESARSSKDSAKARDMDAKAASNQTLKLRGVIRATKDLSSATDHLNDSPEKNVTAIHSLSLAQDLLAKASRDASKAVKEEKDALRGTLIERGKDTTAAKKHGTAIRKLAEASAKATAAHIAEAKAIGLLTTARIKDIVAAREQADVARGIDHSSATQGLLAQAQAQRDLAAAIKETTAAINKVPKGQRKKVVDEATPTPGGGGPGIVPPAPTPVPAQRGRRESDQALTSVATWNAQRQAIRDATIEVENHGNALTEVTSIVGQLGAAFNGAGRHVKGADEKVSRFGKDRSALQNVISGFSLIGDKAEDAGNRLGSLKDTLMAMGKAKFPGIAAPMVALVPLIATVLSMVNPLIAGIGALGGAFIGLASSIGVAVGGLAAGLIPALVSVLSVVGAVKTAMGGVGGVFAAAKQAKEAKKKKAGGGGGGPKAEELTKAEKIARAEEMLKRATEDVKDAQDNLDEARKGYIERLKALKKAVDEAAKAELRLRANQQLARENLANVLADPGSTKGEKMAARAELAEANEALKEGREGAKKNSKDLKDMQKKGVEGDKDVIAAKRRLQDAIWNQRDAEIALHNSHKDLTGSAGAAAKAEDALADALAELSPSARKAVEALLAMQAAWDAMKKSVQEAFFKPFADNVKNLSGLIQPLTEYLSLAAGAAGEFVDKLITKVTSPDWIRDIGIIGKGNVPIIKNMGDGLLSIADAFRHITVAGQPFITKITAGIAKGAEEFSNWMSNARDDGTLAKFFEDSYDHLSLWWRVLKNIGGTIMNFLRAAEPFGRWLTQTFVAITDGWKKASEDALKPISVTDPMSKFQHWLENIKPILREVGGLIGDFFKWFGREASEEGNINQIVAMFKTLREDIGPAIGKIFDAMAKAELGPKAFEAIGSILKAIATFLDNGGAEGLGLVWDAIKGIALALEALFAAIPPPLLTAIGVGLGTITAALVVWAGLKFSGLIGLFKLMQKGGLASFGTFGLGPKAGKRQKVGLPGIGYQSKTTRRYKQGELEHARWEKERTRYNVMPATKAEKAAQRRTAIQQNILPSRPAGPTRAERNAAKAAERQAKFRQSLLGPSKAEIKEAHQMNKPVKPGRFANVRRLAAAESQGGFLDLGASTKASKLGTPGLSRGARAAEMFPTFTKAGSGLGKVAKMGSKLGRFGGLGALAASFAIDPLQKAVDDERGGARSTGAQLAGGAAQGALIGSLAGPIGAAVGGAIGLAVAGINIDPEQWSKTMEELASVGSTMTAWWDEKVIQPISGWITTLMEADIGGWLKEQWNTWVVVPFQGIVAWFRETWQTWVVTPFTTAINWIRTTWDTVTAWFRKRGTDIADAWNSVTAWFRKRAHEIQTAWNNMVGFFRGIPERLHTAWTNMVGFFRGIPNRIHNAWNGMLEWFRNVPGEMIQAVRDWVSKQVDKVIPEPVKKVAGAVGNFIGKVTPWAEGGEIPGSGNSDTVPAMLTPGEFVIRKAVASQIGADTLNKINSGMTGMMAGRTYQPGPSIPRQYATGGVVAPTGGVGASGGNIVVENLTVNNPSPERAGDSLPRTIRKMSYIGRGVRPT